MPVYDWGPIKGFCFEFFSKAPPSPPIENPQIRRSNQRGGHGLCNLEVQESEGGANQRGHTGTERNNIFNGMCF